MDSSFENVSVGKLDKKTQILKENDRHFEEMLLCHMSQFPHFWKEGKWVDETELDVWYWQNKF